MIIPIKPKIAIGFTIKPAAIKPKRISNPNKKLTRLLYSIIRKTDNGFIAYINTKGLEGFENTTILEPTKQSLELKGKVDIFLHEKDKTGHWVHIMRNELQSVISPGSEELYSPLCDGGCFSGYIVKIDGVMLFDINKYHGRASQCITLLSITNINKKDNEE